jgi:hypothetical protein
VHRCSLIVGRTAYEAIPLVIQAIIIGLLAWLLGARFEEGGLATVARFNPVNWAVQAGREALLASPDWSFVLPRLGGLLLVATLLVALATRAFRSYQRST